MSFHFPPPGYVGCSEDALTILNFFCSGKTSCSIQIPSYDLDALQPCPEEFKVYLEVAYRCVEGNV